MDRFGPFCVRPFVLRVCFFYLISCLAERCNVVQVESRVGNRFPDERHSFQSVSSILSLIGAASFDYLHFETGHPDVEAQRRLGLVSRALVGCRRTVTSFRTNERVVNQSAPLRATVCDVNEFMDDPRFGPYCIPTCCIPFDDDRPSQSSIITLCSPSCERFALSLLLLLLLPLLLFLPAPV